MQAAPVRTYVAARKECPTARGFNITSEVGQLAKGSEHRFYISEVGQLFGILNRM